MRNHSLTCRNNVELTAKIDAINKVNEISPTIFSEAKKMLEPFYGKKIYTVKEERTVAFSKEVEKFFDSMNALFPRSHVRVHKSGTCLWLEVSYRSFYDTPTGQQYEKHENVYLIAEFEHHSYELKPSKSEYTFNQKKYSVEEVRQVEKNVKEIERQLEDTLKDYSLFFQQY